MWSVFVETFLICMVAKTKLETCKVHKYHLQLKKKIQTVKFKQNDMCDSALKSVGYYSNRSDCGPWPNTSQGYCWIRGHRGLHTGSPGYQTRQWEALTEFQEGSRTRTPSHTSIVRPAFTFLKMHTLGVFALGLLLKCKYLWEGWHFLTNSFLGVEKRFWSGQLRFGSWECLTRGLNLANQPLDLLRPQHLQLRKGHWAGK